MENQILQLKKQDAIATYKSGSPEVKEMLRKLYPSCTFEINPADEVKEMLRKLYPSFTFEINPADWVKNGIKVTWEQICEAYMQYEHREIKDAADLALPYASPKNSFQEWINGCHMVGITVFVLNGGRIVEMADENLRKYWIWWEYSKLSGFRFSNTYYDWSLTNTTVGPRLCFFDPNTAKYGATVLTAIFEKMFGQPKIQKY